MGAGGDPGIQLTKLVVAYAFATSVKLVESCLHFGAGRKSWKDCCQEGKGNNSPGTEGTKEELPELVDDKPTTHARTGSQ